MTSTIFGESNGKPPLVWRILLFHTDPRELYKLGTSDVFCVAESVKQRLFAARYLYK